MSAQPPMMIEGKARPPRKPWEQMSAAERWSARREDFRDELERAAKAGVSEEEARALVQANLDFVDCGLSDGRAHALHVAARNGSVELTRALLEAGAHPDAETKLGATPLMAACSGTRGLEIARELLKAGASARESCSICDGAEILALDTVGRRPVEDTAALLTELIKAGAPAAPVWEEITGRCLRWEDRRMWEAMVDAVLESGAMIDAKDEESETALSRAVRWGLSEGDAGAAKFLLSRGANPNEPSPKESVLRLAAQSPQRAGVELSLALLEAGASLRRRDGYGFSLAELAADKESKLSRRGAALGLIAAWIERDEMSGVCASAAPARKGPTL